MPSNCAVCGRYTIHFITALAHHIGLYSPRPSIVSK